MPVESDRAALQVRPDQGRARQGVGELERLDLIQSPLLDVARTEQFLAQSKGGRERPRQHVAASLDHVGPGGIEPDGRNLPCKQACHGVVQSAAIRPTQSLAVEFLVEDGPLEAAHEQDEEGASRAGHAPIPALQVLQHLDGFRVAASVIDVQGADHPFGQERMEVELEGEEVLDRPVVAFAQAPLDPLRAVVRRPLGFERQRIALRSDVVVRCPERPVGAGLDEGVRALRVQSAPAVAFRRAEDREASIAGDPVGRATDDGEPGRSVQLGADEVLRRCHEACCSLAYGITGRVLDE